MHPSQLLQAVRLVQAILLDSWVSAASRLRNTRTCQTLAFAAHEFYLLDATVNYTDAVDFAAELREPKPMRETIEMSRTTASSRSEDQRFALVVKCSVV